MNLKCYNVKCIDNKMNEYTIGVIADNEFSACHVAENSLWQGKNIKAKAIEAKLTDRI